MIMIMIMMMIIVHLYSADIHYLPDALYKSVPKNVRFGDKVLASK